MHGIPDPKVRHSAYRNQCLMRLKIWQRVVHLGCGVHCSFGVLGLAAYLKTKLERHVVEHAAEHAPRHAWEHGLQHAHHVPENMLGTEMPVLEIVIYSTHNNTNKSIEEMLDNTHTKIKNGLNGCHFCKLICLKYESTTTTDLV